MSGIGQITGKETTNQRHTMKFTQCFSSMSSAGTLSHNDHRVQITQKGPLPLSGRNKTNLDTPTPATRLSSF